MSDDGEALDVHGCRQPDDESTLVVLDVMRKEWGDVERAKKPTL